ncbi:peptidylprolyl isomerase, partial [Thioclava sp. BHET1]
MGTQPMAKSKTGKDSAKRETRKKGNAGQVLVWLMLGMVVFGLGGYGVTNFSGNINSIGSVGDQEISTADYSRALQQELAAYRQQMGNKLTAKQALAMGLDSTVRAQLITTAALDDEDQRIGLSVGNGALRDAIRALPAFQGPDGKFDDSTYKLVLQQNGLSVSDFEAKMRRQLTQKILEAATKGAVPAPKAYISTLEAYIGQNRSFSTLTVTDKDLTAALPMPSDKDLKTYYDAHKSDFTAPEAKMISYVSLTPEMLAGKMKVDPKQLDQVYQQNKDQFDKPEKRLVERLVYPTEAAAQAAKAELDSGKATFADLVKARGLAMADVDMGDVTKDDLSDDAAEAVFGLDKPGVVGPVKSALGPALFRMNAIIPADSTGADEARAELAEGLRTQKARQAISNQVEDITNKLAAGATLEDLAKETDMKLAKITYTAGDKDGIAAYPAFRTAADAVKDGDYPQLIQLKGGGIAALRLDSIRKAALIPYDKVADKVKA